MSNQVHNSPFYCSDLVLIVLPFCTFSFDSQFYMQHINFTCNLNFSLQHQTFTYCIQAQFLHFGVLDSGKSHVLQYLKPIQNRFCLIWSCIVILKNRSHSDSKKLNFGKHISQKLNYNRKNLLILIYLKITQKQLRWV